MPCGPIIQLIPENPLRAPSSSPHPNTQRKFLRLKASQSPLPSNNSRRTQNLIAPIINTLSTIIYFTNTIPSNNPSLNPFTRISLNPTTQHPQPSFHHSIVLSSQHYNTQSTSN